MVEFRGLTPENIAALDSSSLEWRKLYFLRNSIRTLYEIFRVVDAMQRNPEFRRILEKHPSAAQRDVKTLMQQINKNRQLVGRLRNSIGGGHVQRSDVQRMLNNLDPDAFGFIEIGDRLEGTHFKFVGELVAATMVADIPQTDKVAKLEADVRQISQMLPIVVEMEKFLTMYLDSRGLI
jgi:hypothetical protein